MAKLAIRGHASLGEEIIKILSMLGGNNAFGHYGDNSSCVYYVDKSYKNHIICSRTNENNLTIFTLEEFIENFPYKVGDKVLINDDKNDVYTVKSMAWNEDFNRVAYKIEAVDGIMDDHTWFAHEMHAVVSFNTEKEETVEEKGDKAKTPNLIGEDYSGKRYGYKIPNGYEFDCIINDEIILKPKQPQYPKTCEECCKILKIPTNGDIIYAGNWTWGGEYLDEHLDKIRNFQKLVICRDAYWKLAGEQMELGKSWEPDWSIDDDIKYVIEVYRNNVRTNSQGYSNTILAFPTEEMRDTFYENFKDLIEQCKEFL